MVMAAPANYCNKIFNKGVINDVHMVYMGTY